MCFIFEGDDAMAVLTRPTYTIGMLLRGQHISSLFPFRAVCDRRVSNPCP